MQLMASIYYWLLVFKNDYLKYKATSQRKFFNLFSLFHIFFSYCLLFYYFFSNSYAHNVFNLYYISYTLRFCYVMHYLVSEICIGGRFFEDCFYCYPQQVISAIASESLIPYKKPIKKFSETQNF